MYISTCKDLRLQDWSLVSVATVSLEVSAQCTTQPFFFRSSHSARSPSHISRAEDRSLYDSTLRCLATNLT